MNQKHFDTNILSIFLCFMHNDSFNQRKILTILVVKFKTIYFVRILNEINKNVLF